MGHGISLGQVDVDLGVHGVKLLLVERLDALSLHLESGSGATVFNSPDDVGDKDVSWFLNIVETALFAHGAHFGDDGFLEFGVLGKRLCVFGVLAVGLSPLLSTFVKGNNHDSVTLERISVHKAGANKLAGTKGFFELLGSDILTLRKFHDHLGTVNDGKGTILVDPSNITRVEPTLIVEGFCSDFLQLVVAFEDVRTFHLDLSTGVRLVGAEVVHIREILQSDFGTSDRSSNMAEVRVFPLGGCSGSRCLTESVSFKEGTSERDFDESHNFLVHRSGSSNHGLDLSSKVLFDLLEDEEVVASVSIGRVCVVISSLSGQG